MRKIEFNIGNVGIGGDSPLAIQTMCNTHTKDVEASVAQCRRMAAAGAQFIRLTTQGIAEVEALKEIKRRLREDGIETPLVADVHFNSDVAIEAARVADKVRINPGNFAAVHKDAENQFRKFIAVCKEYGTAVRIGLNHGSLGEEIVNRYGNTPVGMKEAVMQWLRMCRALDFERVVVSLKASNTIVMSSAYRLLYKAMEEDGVIYPVHLGVTEAGNADQGRIKSAIGIGALLKEGIGDTIRVSLTEDPVNEIPAGQTIAGYYESGEAAEVQRAIAASVACGESTAYGVCPSVDYARFRVGRDCASDPSGAWNEFIIKAACSFGTMLLDKQIDDFEITGAPFSSERMTALKEDIQQAARRRFSHPEYIACPGCGRTMYNLEETFNRVKERTAHLKGVRIAIMGCIVNGPGEMADADYGYVGQGGGMVTIYRGKEPVRRDIPDSEAIELLLKLIEEDRG